MSYRTSLPIPPLGFIVWGRVLPDSIHVNHVLVKDGWYWWYRKYAPGAVLEGLEKEAREAKRGLWADPQPVPP